MKLWKHQRQAIDFIGNRAGTLLAMDMGTGKTAVAIHALDKKGRNAALVLCPKSVASVWPGEFVKHSKRHWNILDLSCDTIAKRSTKLENWLDSREGPTALIVNYDILTYDIGKEFIAAARRRAFDALIMDECHRMKSPGGKQSRRVSIMSDHIPFRLGLTGTPMPSGPLDLYGQFRAIDKTLFGTSYLHFRNNYALMGTRGYNKYKVLEYINLDVLHTKLYSRTFRCEADEVLDLPATMDITRTCILGPKTRKVYMELSEEFVAEIESGQITADNGLVRLLRLSEVANGIGATENGREVIGTEKIQAFGEVLAELHSDYDKAPEPIVVFARFTADLNAIKAKAAQEGWTPGELSGKQDDLAAFQRGGPKDPNLLAVQYQAGGVGISMVRACVCIYYSHDYNYGTYLQSRARVHRPGQDRPVRYIHMLAENTVDEDIWQALMNKEDIVTAIIKGINLRKRRRK